MTILLEVLGILVLIILATYTCLLVGSIIVAMVEIIVALIKKISN